METEPRKASDVLLALESKINQLLDLNRSQDLVIKVLTNKLNKLMEDFGAFQVNQMNQTRVGTVSASVSPVIEIPSVPASQMSVEVNPTGFRRTSRPETFSSPSAPKKAPAPPAPPPEPLPAPTPGALVQFPNYDAPPPQSVTPQPSPAAKKAAPVSTGNKLPVEQRICDKEGKAIFLANIEIFNSQGENVFTGRTNGVGKWQASLAPDQYKIKISKQASISKEKIDLTQDIKVIGNGTTETLPTLICK